MKQLRKHLTFANVVSCVALFLALGGAAVAAKTAAKVKTKDLANGVVTTPKLHNGAVTTPKLRNRSVISTKIAPGNVGTEQLADGAVRAKQLGGQVVTEAKIKEGAVTSNKLAPNFLGQLVRNVSYVGKATETNATSPKSITADCPTGKLAIGGGARSLLGTSKEAMLVESIPFVNVEGKQIGWTAAAASPSGTFAVEAVAICAEI